MARQHFLYTEGGGFKIQAVADPESIEFIVIDLFCGAGGTSTGFDRANLKGKKVALVAACINHDPKAIISHWKNYPEVIHFEEDIRTLKLSGLCDIIRKYRMLYPNAKVILWASLECTNFSKAKGGMPRDADSRSLAESLYSIYDPIKKVYHVGDSYIQLLNPDYIQIENVVEFMAWGPMRIACKKRHKTYSELKFIKNKKTGLEEYAWIPESKKNGKDFQRWREKICSFGYTDEWRELNSADYGAYTSRNRLFGCFAKPGLPIVWPQVTHAKSPVNNGLFGTLKKWMPVKDVLDFGDEGLSIFNRIVNCKNVKSARKLFFKQKDCKKIYIASTANLFHPVLLADPSIFDDTVNELLKIDPKLSFYYPDELVDASLERIEAGLIKFVAGGKDAFLLKYNSMAKNGDRKHSVMDVEKPGPALPCQNRTGLCFIAKYYSGAPSGKILPVTGPVGALKCKDGQSVINCQYFLAKSYSGKPEGKVIPVTGPAGAIPCAGNHSLINVQPFIMNTNFKNVGSSINDPVGVLTASRHHPYVLNPCFLTKYYGTGTNIVSIDEPAPTFGIKDTCGKIQTIFFDKTFSGNGNSNQYQSINQPAGAILKNDKHRLIHCQPFILNPSHGGHTTSVEAPCVVIIARQDKAPLLLVTFVEDPSVAIPIYDDDSAVMIRIKNFMAMYGLADIKMRMLKVVELKEIQGFGADYKLEGSQTDQKKFIGNSVVPHVVTSWCLAMASRNREIRIAA